MKHLSLFNPSTTAHLAQPKEFFDLDLASPAVQVMTDFRCHKPSMVGVDESVKVLLDRAEIVKTGDFWVMDSRAEFVGIVAAEHLSSQHVQLRRLDLGLKLNELTLRDIMLPRQSLQALELAEVMGATIGDLVATLRDSGQTYLLVIDREQHQIRGVISAKQIEERLHNSLEIRPKLTFVDIFTAIRAH